MSTATQKLTVQGRVVVEGPNTESEHGIPGEPCSTDGNLPMLAKPTLFDDVKAGAQVVVTNASGLTVGVGTLAPGESITAIDSAPINCAWTFSVFGVASGSAFYGVKIANEPVKQVAAAAIGTVEIDLGG
jgi:hypothetical protein